MSDLSAGYERLIVELEAAGDNLVRHTDIYLHINNDNNTPILAVTKAIKQWKNIRGGE